MSKVISGTKEWSVESVNCVTGCSHDCRYCYAREMAVRYNRRTLKTWVEMEVREHEVAKKRKKVNGTVMFPTTHDITLDVLSECLHVLIKLLQAGNKVLVVSKPHLECIEVICQELKEWKEQILFRFTIGAMTDGILSVWEPGAPLYHERVASLAYAFTKGFRTSVSCEPLLESEKVKRLVYTLGHFVNDSIWIGTLNKINSRVQGVPKEEVDRVKRGQTLEAMRKVHSKLKHYPLIRWKESYKKVLGMEIPQVAGLDV